jgi:preprotein translocase subunit SecG
MKRTTIILVLLFVLAILAFSRTDVRRVPGETTQAEQRRIKGMSVIVDDL